MSLSSRTARTALFACLLTVVAACQSQAPTIRSEAAPGVDFVAYKSFDFMTPLSTDQNGYSTLTTGHLKDAVKRELVLRGYTQTAEKPDILVNFSVSTRESVSSGSSPRVGVSYGGWSGGGHGMGIGMSTGGGVESHTEGTLTIDLVDRAANRLVWTGSAEGRLPRDAASRRQAIIDSAVRAIFAKYPAHQAMP